MTDLSNKVDPDNLALLQEFIDKLSATYPNLVHQALSVVLSSLLVQATKKQTEIALDVCRRVLFDVEVKERLLGMDDYVAGWKRGA